MLLPLFSSVTLVRLFGRFRRDRRGSTAVEFALVVPIFLALLFALFETAMIFFAGQVLENAVQDSGRLIYTYQASGLSKTTFKNDFCPRIATLFNCDEIDLDLQSYPPGAVIPTAAPYDSAGVATAAMVWDPPPLNSPNTVVLRAFNKWPLYVTQLGYNIANINRDEASGRKRLMVATAAFRVEPQ